MSNRISAGGGQCFLVHCHVYYQKAIEQIDIYIVYIYSIYIYYSYDDLRWFSWCHQNLPLFQTLPHQRVQVGLPELGRCWEVLEPIAVERGRLSCASESPRGVQEFSLRSLNSGGSSLKIWENVVALQREVSCQCSHWPSLGAPCCISRSDQKASEGENALMRLLYVALTSQKNRPKWV